MTTLSAQGIFMAALFHAGAAGCKAVSLALLRHISAERGFQLPFAQLKASHRIPAQGNIFLEVS